MENRNNIIQSFFVGVCASRCHPFLFLAPRGVENHPCSHFHFCFWKKSVFWCQASRHKVYECIMRWFLPCQLRAVIGQRPAVCHIALWRIIVTPFYICPNCLPQDMFTPIRRNKSIILLPPTLQKCWLIWRCCRIQKSHSRSLFMSVSGSASHLNLSARAELIFVA